MGKRTRNIFFTSDHHYFHESSLKLDNRPFKDMDEMIVGLRRRHNSMVGENDICYFLGDMGFSGGDLKSVMDKLNGTKILILGNHDKKQQAMLNSGFDAAMNSCSMYIANELVTMSHCPLRGVWREDTTGMRKFVVSENWHGESRHEEFLVEDKGQFHLHGHIHSPNGGKSTRTLGRQLDVGVTANNYSPVSISQIESWIVRTKREENE